MFTRDSIHNKPLFTDESGNEVYQCQYSNKLISKDKSIFLGTMIPQAPGKYVCHPDGVAARKVSYKIFCDEIEKNCNTCKHLERLPHKKDIDGFMHGNCKSKPINHPYEHRFESHGHMIFHPEDCMAMECYEPR